jgi:2',3'-cyclic-nucleotide 2'-phosphodiesterase (5'-nucleotidase family)
VEVVFLQMNDVYEITPVEGGKYGGLARVSQLRNELTAQNPNTFTVLAGDFISPSALGTAEWDGSRINGAQMVDALNNAGLDFVTFGNHEFDYKYEVLQSRMDESKFEWISSNAYHNQNGLYQPFGKTDHPLPQYVILKIPYENNKTLRVGLIGLTIDANKQLYVYYENQIEAAKRVYSNIKDSIDYLIALTHLSIEQDKELASAFPEIKFIMGGHEHNNMYVKQGETIIAKADANAKTVYIHHLVYDTQTKELKINSDLKTIDSSIKDDPKTWLVTDKWVQRAYSGFRSKGFEPDEVVTTLNDSLDGLEYDIRFKQTNLGAVICDAMLLEAGVNSEVAIFNSGSVRLDDVLKGKVTQYDIIRTLPFGGKVIETEMQGDLLLKILNAGQLNKGSGGYLQHYGINYDSISNSWGMGMHDLSPKETYKVAISDYLLTGMEKNMDFLTRKNSGILKISEPQADDKSDLRNDIRLAVIKYLKEKYK